MKRLNEFLSFIILNLLIKYDVQIFTIDFVPMLIIKCHKDDNKFFKKDNETVTSIAI